MQIIYTMAVTVPDDKTAARLSDDISLSLQYLAKQRPATILNLLTFRVAGKKDVKTLLPKPQGRASVFNTFSGTLQLTTGVNRTLFDAFSMRAKEANKTKARLLQEVIYEFLERAVHSPVHGRDDAEQAHQHLCGDDRPVGEDGGAPAPEGQDGEATLEMV